MVWQDTKSSHFSHQDRAVSELPILKVRGVWSKIISQSMSSGKAVRVFNPSICVICLYQSRTIQSGGKPKGLGTLLITD